MKLVVFSDSHHSLRAMRDAIDREQPDGVIHLGDLERDAQLLSQEYPLLPITGVPGNCDGIPTSPLKRLVTYEGIRVLMSHGHIWSVKSGYGAAISAAEHCKAHLVLFGHTHVPYCQQLDSGLWAMNPGSCRDSGSYGLALIQQGRLTCQLKKT